MEKMGWIMVVFLGIALALRSYHISESSYRDDCAQRILLPPLARNVQSLLLPIRILCTR